MKKIASLFLSALFLVFICAPAAAEESDILEEMSVANQPVQTTKPNPALTTGRTLVWTGVGLIASGIVTGIGSNAIFNAVSQPTDTGVHGVVAGMFPVLTGAVVGLAGIPFLIVGNNKLETSVAPGLVQIGRAGGFGAIFEAGGGMSSFDRAVVSGSAIFGYNVTKRIFAGAGAGLNYMGCAAVPVFADVRYSFSDAAVVPYIGADVGYELVEKAPYVRANFGVRMLSGNGGKAWWISACSEFQRNSKTPSYSEWTENDNYFVTGIKIGYSF